MKGVTVNHNTLNLYRVIASCDDRWCLSHRVEAELHVLGTQESASLAADRWLAEQDFDIIIETKRVAYVASCPTSSGYLISDYSPIGKVVGAAIHDREG